MNKHFYPFILSSILLFFSISSLDFKKINIEIYDIKLILFPVVILLLISIIILYFNLNMGISLINLIFILISGFIIVVAIQIQLNYALANTSLCYDGIFFKITRLFDFNELRLIEDMLYKKYAPNYWLTNESRVYILNKTWKESKTPEQLESEYILLISQPIPWYIGILDYLNINHIIRGSASSLLTSLITTSFFNILTGYFDFFGGGRVDKVLLSQSSSILHLLSSLDEINATILDLNKRVLKAEDYLLTVKNIVVDINDDYTEFRKLTNDSININKWSIKSIITTVDNMYSKGDRKFANGYIRNFGNIVSKEKYVFHNINNEGSSTHNIQDSLGSGNKLDGDK